MAEDKKQKWDGRISTRVPKNSFPELFEDLSHLSHRYRGDRLRSLAVVGLSVMKNLGQGIHAPLGTADPSKASDSAEDQNDAKAAKENDDDKIKQRRDSLRSKANF